MNLRMGMEIFARTVRISQRLRGCNHRNVRVVPVKGLQGLVQNSALSRNYTAVYLSKLNIIVFFA